MIEKLLEINNDYPKGYLQKIGCRFMYYNLSTNHEIYGYGELRLRFERIDDDLRRYLGILCLQKDK